MQWNLSTTGLFFSKDQAMIHSAILTKGASYKKRESYEKLYKTVIRTIYNIDNPIVFLTNKMTLSWELPTPLFSRELPTPLFPWELPTLSSFFLISFLSFFTDFRKAEGMSTQILIIDVYKVWWLLIVHKLHSLNWIWQRKYTYIKMTYLFH